MVSAVRRRMQEGVDVTRGLHGAINGRVVPECVVIAQVSAIRNSAADLAAGIVIPEADGIARIQSRIQAAVASLTIDELAVDTATVDTVRNVVTRGILQQQVPEIALLYLVDAVLSGVELGLRDVIRAHASRGTRAGPPPPPVPKPAPEEPRSRAPPVSRDPPAIAQRSPPKPRSGPTPAPEDTVDI